MSFLLPSKKRPPKTGHGSGSGRGSQSKSGRGSKSSSKQNDPDEGQEDEPYDLERETDVAAPRTWAAAEQQHDFEGQVTGQDPATVNYTYGYTQSQPQSSPVRSHTSGIPASLPYGRGAIQFAGGGPIGGPTYRTEPNEALSELTRGMRNLQYSSNTDPYDVTVYRTPFPSAANVPSTSAQLSRAEDALPEEEEDYYGADDGEQSSGRISGATQSQPLYAVTPHRVLQTEESYGLSDENSQDPFQITRASNMLNFDRSDQQMQLSRVDSGSRKSTDITAPTKEALHPDYKVHHASSFQFKKVFKILWPEPTGDHSNNGGTEKIRIKHGEVCYASIRRFVIVYAKEGHCLCLPILTYGGQATRKKGLKAQDHAIVYMDEYRKQKKGFGRGGKGGKAAPPELERGEEKLDKVSIRIVPLTPRDKLDPRSRLNYAKIYTVEYNVKVCFIGKIHESSVKYFKRDYNLTHSPLPLAEGTQYSDEDEDEGEGENEGYE